MARPRKYATKEEAKAAKKAQDAEWQRTHKEAHRASSAEYSQTHREYYTAYNAKYRQDNKEAIATKKAEYYQTLFGMCSIKSNTYRKYDRKRFGTDEGSVTAEQMKEMIELHPNCFYCGCEDITQLGLDRIDNNKPHTVDNCVVACWNCNNERKRMSFEEYLNNVHTRAK